MKKIKVATIRLPDNESVYKNEKKYSVWFGNNVTSLFTSNRKAIDFVAKTNKFLNLTMAELNLIYIDVFTEYRRLWLPIKQDDLIEPAFRNINHAFKYLLKYKKSENYNAFAFVNISKICFEYTNVINILIDDCHKHKNFPAITHLKTILRRIERINNDIESWGKGDNETVSL